MCSSLWLRSGCPAHAYSTQNSLRSGPARTCTTEAFESRTVAGHDLQVKIAVNVAQVETVFTSVSSRSFTIRTVTSLMFVSSVAGSMEMVFPRMARSAAIVMPAPLKT